MMLAFLSATIVLISPRLQTDAGQIPDTRGNHWAYEGKAYLESIHLWYDPTDGLVARPPAPSRYLFAIDFHATATHLMWLAKEVEAEIRKVEHTPRGTPESERVLDELGREHRNFENFTSPEVTQVLLRAKTEFAPELRLLGVTTDVFASAVQKAELTFTHWRTPIPGIALQPFRDVPTNHWAVIAVKELRSAGLIDGYPDGAFKG